MRSTARRGPLFLIVADKFALARQIRRRLIARATIGTQTGVVPARVFHLPESSLEPHRRRTPNCLTALPASSVPCSRERVRMATKAERQ
jgi:hypothetical protein